VQRPDLERELLGVLQDRRHPVVTLIGRGGIGKTWLALSVLHRLAQADDFDAIIWLSARDIDLTERGARTVTPHVLTLSDMAKEFVSLMQPTDAADKGFKALDYLAASLESSSVGPLLFVFDNFETVRSPQDMYRSLDAHIQLPNKILITTRFREFKGDYPVEVSGMTEAEFAELVQRTAARLGIKELVSKAYLRDLYLETDGHPYVAKVHLGEVAKAGQALNVQRVVASQDEMLQALFERTYAGLSPVAKRVFLTLCNWNSTVPQIGLEAVLLRPDNDRMDVVAGTDELIRSSFIEATESEDDGQLFLNVPLAARVYGEKKLLTSPLKIQIESDTRLLHAFGANQQIDRGVAPRIARLFRSIAREVTAGRQALDEHLPMLRFIAGKYPPAWLYLSRLYEEVEDGPLPDAQEAMRRYLECSIDETEADEAWARLATLYSRTADAVSEAHALVERALLPHASVSTLSNTANRLNAQFRHGNLVLENLDRFSLTEELLRVAWERVSELSATDCSRLGWLSLQSHDEELATKFVLQGLEKSPGNEHCVGLCEQLGLTGTQPISDTDLQGQTGTPG
jgi:hypothetical protein